jgi:hypothetical protein
MDPLEFHPLAELFPMMSDEEVDTLGEDMLAHGQLKRIIRYEGKILDGRNRKGIEPRIVDYHGPDPLGLVAALNLKRRHLDDAQRGVIAAKLATMKSGDNQHSPNGGTSQAKAAELLNVSKRRVERSREVIEKGVPDLVDAVEHGEVKASAAAEFAEQNLPIEQARLIAEAGSAAAAVKASKPNVKAKADRAASKMPRPVADPKPAADRAEARARLDAVRATYVAAVEAAHLTVTQRTNEIRMVVRQLDTDGLPNFRLLLGSSHGGKLN